MLTVGLFASPAPARRPWSSSSPARMPSARSEISGKERLPPPPPARRGKAEETLTPPSARAERTSEVEREEEEEEEVLALPETRGPPMVLFTYEQVNK